MNSRPVSASAATGACGTRPMRTRTKIQNLSSCRDSLYRSGPSFPSSQQALAEEQVRLYSILTASRPHSGSHRELLTKWPLSSQASASDEYQLSVVRTTSLQMILKTWTFCLSKVVSSSLCYTRKA